MKPWQGEGVIASLPMYQRPELVDAHDRYLRHSSDRTSPYLAVPNPPDSVTASL